MQEKAEQNLSFAGKLTARLIGKTIERSIIALMSAFHDEHLKILMDNNYFIIETVLNAARTRPNYERYNFTAEQIQQLETKRVAMTKRALGIIGMIRSVTTKATMFRDEMTLENVRKWLQKERPTLLATIDAHPNKTWLAGQIKEIQTFFWNG